MNSEVQTQAELETILRPGQIVDGKYRVGERIGKGGMAAVWAGTNERTGKRVALKVILRSFAATGDAAELFRREALAASRVNHPNVVTVFDVIDHEGMACIVMEMLDGETFGTYLARKGFLGVEEAVTLLLPAMRGVAAANALGVIHRDLKPQNIFLCIGPDGRLVTTKVLDFGISVMMERALNSKEATVQLTTHGTPAYMSPEHIAGEPGIDERADVYGFGVLFFEALTGQIPFLGEPGPALLVRIMTEPAPKVTLFRPDLPPQLVRILECAMAKQPADRFRNLDAFIQAIEENLLPRSNLPRALTPMAGVPQISMGQVMPSLAEAIVPIAHSAAQTDSSEINATKMLYSLPMIPGAAEAEPSHKVVDEAAPSPDSPQTQTAPVQLRLSTLKARIGLGALTAAMVGLIIWLAMPMPPSSRDGRKEPQAASRSNESPKMRPSPTSPSGDPGLAQPAPVPSTSTRDSVPNLGQALPEETPPHNLAVRPPMPPSTTLSIYPKPSGSSPDPSQVREVAGTGARGSTQHAPNNRPSPTARKPAFLSPPIPPRAGNLSPDDF